MGRRALSVLLLLSLSACSRCALQRTDPEEAPAREAARPRSEPAREQPSEEPAPPREATGDEATRRLEHLEVVTGGASADDELPMIVAIHGLGSSPDRFARLFHGLEVPARVVLPAGTTPWGPGFSWMSPSLDDAAAQRQIDDAADRVAGLIQEVRASRPTSGRAVVTGFSQGGILSFVVAVRHPRLVAAAVPVSGRLPRPAWPPVGGSGRATPVIRALHGAADRRVASLPARRGVVRLRSAGWDARIRLYGGVEHRISPGMRRDLYALLAAAVEGRTGGAEPCPRCPGESVDPESCSLCSD